MAPLRTPRLPDPSPGLFRAGLLGRALALAGLLTTTAGGRAAAESGFAFLRLPVSARSAGLGESGVSYLRGASALYANPAGLAVPGEERSASPWGLAGEIGLTHDEAFGDLRQDAVVVALGRGRTAAGLGFNTLYSESIERRDEVGTITGTWGLVSYVAQAGVARRLPAGWRVGASAGYVRERIADEAASTWSLGAGAMWEVPAVSGLTVGAAVRHLGASTEFDLEGSPGESVSLPLTTQAGVSYAGRAGRGPGWLVAVEARKARDDDATGHAGLELRWAPVAVRAGTRLGADSGRFTAGLGLEAGRFRFDYAFQPSGEELGESHRAELSARFGL